MKKSMRFRISGSIQPVFFNKFIKDQADKLGIKGFVRHQEDGKVEIFIEGHVDAVNQITPIIRRGPKHSLIRDVKEREEKFQDFKDFRVLDF